MKVYVYPADTTGCGYYRAIWPAKAVTEKYDIEIVVSAKDDQKNDLQAEVRDGKIYAVKFPEDADVIVMQRPMHVWLGKAIPYLRMAGVAVVVDIDDDLESLHPAHPAYASLHPRNNQVYNWNVARQSCRDATLVTVSTEPLRKMYTPLTGECRVIKNGVPESFFEINEPTTTSISRTIGWMGSVHSHPDDLQAMGQTPSRLQREGFPWKFVGPDRGIQTALRFDTEPFATGYVQMEDIPWEIQRTIGIGVAPLQDTRFNRAKSYLKELEYSALGVPSVCSDLPEYRELAQHTGALMARRPKDWYQHLKRLATDDAFRTAQGEKARRGAARHTIESKADQWAQAWLTAYKMAQTGR